MNLCADCKYYFHKHPIDIWEALQHKSHRCLRNAEYVIEDPVLGLGKTKGEVLDCYTERENALRLEEFRCGKDGKFWEAK